MSRVTEIELIRFTNNVNDLFARSDFQSISTVISQLRAGLYKFTNLATGQPKLRYLHKGSIDLFELYLLLLNTISENYSDYIEVEMLHLELDQNSTIDINVKYKKIEIVSSSLKHTKNITVRNNLYIRNSKINHSKICVTNNDLHLIGVRPSHENDALIITTNCNKLSIEHSNYKNIIINNSQIYELKLLQINITKLEIRHTSLSYLITSNILDLSVTNHSNIGTFVIGSTTIKFLSNNSNIQTLSIPKVSRNNPISLLLYNTNIKSINAHESVFNDIHLNNVGLQTPPNLVISYSKVYNSLIIENSVFEKLFITNMSSLNCQIRLVNTTILNSPSFIGSTLPNSFDITRSCKLGYNDEEAIGHYSDLKNQMHKIKKDRLAFWFASLEQKAIYLNMKEHKYNLLERISSRFSFYFNDYGDSLTKPILNSLILTFITLIIYVSIFSLFNNDFTYLKPGIRFTNDITAAHITKSSAYIKALYFSLIGMLGPFGFLTKTLNKLEFGIIIESVLFVHRAISSIFLYMIIMWLKKVHRQA